MAAQAWRMLADLYLSQSCACTVNTRIALTMIKKLQLSVSDYYSKMRQYADELVATGAPLRDDEFVTYLLTGLDEEYNPVFTAIVAQPDPISPSEFFAQLLSFEQHTSLQAHDSSGPSSAMTASRGRGFSSGRDPGGIDQGQGHGRGCGRSTRGSFTGDSRTSHSSGNSRPQCQVCLKFGHTTDRCWHSFEEDYVPEQRTTAATYHSWYTDSGATDHITGDLDKLIMHEPYTGNDQIHVANMRGMGITRVGSSIIPTPSRPLALNNVLHVSTASKNLISVHHFTLDNNIFIEVHPYFFLIKDRQTKKALLHGACKGGLYPLPSSTSKFCKLVFNAIKISVDQWHSHLGHPSRDIVCRIISTNNLPCAVYESSSQSVCDACACAKAHQLPYQVSTSHSLAPLDFIFSDVWGPAIDSFGCKKYYVSFIDDYTKFTWLYLLRHKSDVFHYFLEFQAFVERQMNKKIIVVQSDWGGEYEHLNSYFRKLGISHQVSCPHTHQ
jgi:hypothetical protein